MNTNFVEALKKNDQGHGRELHGEDQLKRGYRFLNLRMFLLVLTQLLENYRNDSINENGTAVCKEVVYEFQEKLELPQDAIISRVFTLSV